MPATPSALDTSPQERGPVVTLCGWQRTSPPIITEDSVGPLALDVPLEAARAKCPEAIDTVLPDGFRGFHVTAFGALLMVLTDGRDDPVEVTMLRVAGGSEIHTVEGVGPGSTLADAERAWGALETVSCPTGLAGAQVKTRSYYLKGAIDCGSPRAERAPSVDTVTIRAIYVLRPVD